MFFANPRLAFGGAINIAKYEIVRDVPRWTTTAPAARAFPVSRIWRTQ